MVSAPRVSTIISVRSGFFRNSCPPSTAKLCPVIQDNSWPCQEAHGFADIHRAAGPPQGKFVDEFFQRGRILKEVANPIRLGEAGAHRVDPYAGRPQFFGGGANECSNPPLAV